MSDVKEKLVKCFRIVFPGLLEASIPAASVSNVAAWDSVQAITLLHIVGEEFEMEIDFDRLAELDSFAKLAAYLTEKIAQSSPNTIQ